VNENAASRTALFGLATLAAFKFVALLFGIRLLFGGTPAFISKASARALVHHRVFISAVLIVIYGAQFVFCLILRHGVRSHRAWAVTATYIYAGFHVVGIIFTPLFGIASVTNAVVGGLVFFSLRKAEQLASATMAPPNSG
jgi:hypothetical protein